MEAPESGNAARAAIVERLWGGRDPFAGLPANLFAPDLQGWKSHHPSLAETIAELRPALIVEVGVWKGKGVVHMARELERLGLAGSVVLAVDTWLGSAEHWLGERNPDLAFLHGRPGLYYTFLANVIREGLERFVVPLPIDSLNGAQIVRELGLAPAMIHLDGAHDYASVAADLAAWWPLLAPGGALIGDDYYADGPWPEVKAAFDHFFAGPGMPEIENVHAKCRVRKGRAGFVSPPAPAGKSEQDARAP